VTSFNHKYANTQAGQPRSALYGAAATRKGGGIEHADRFGTNLAIRSSAVPAVAEYDDYLKRQNERRINRIHAANKTGARLRRIVIMRREGASWKSCGDATGVSGACAKGWVEYLPQALGVNL